MSQFPTGGVAFTTGVVVRTANVLYPPFAGRVARALAAAQAAGHDVHIFESWRCAARQSELYAQGRTAKGGIVTRADAWQSWHQYGLAVDVAFGGVGKWNWDGDFAAVNVFMAAEGLHWLAPFEDDHWQLPVAMTIERARALAIGVGVPGVWAEIEQQLAS